MRRLTPGCLAAVLLLTVLPVPADGAALEAFVDPELVRAWQADPSARPVILVLDPAREASVLGALQREGIPFHSYDRLHMASALLERSRLDDVARLPGVLTVYRNERMSLTLDKAASHVAATVVWDTYRVRGEGRTTLVVDTGIDGTHPDLRYGESLRENVIATRGANQLIGGSATGIPATDSDGHGTHVAGIVAGAGKALGRSLAGRYKGLAYEGQVIGYAAGLLEEGSSEPTFESITVLEAFNWAIANHRKYGIDIVSNSWGADGDFEPRSPVNTATLNLYKAGMLVVFAAGNEGAKGAGNLNKYCVPPWVLCVGAGDFLPQLAKFSSRGTDPEKSNRPYDHPDILAPGVQITSARALADPAVGGKSLLDPVQTVTVQETSLYVAKSGTSMATPMVAGIASLLLAANPKLSPDDLMDILVATATPMRGYDVWEVGAGYVHALRAYQLAVKTPGQRDLFMSGKVKYAGDRSQDPTFARDAVTVGYGNGTLRQFRPGDTSLPNFATQLVETPLGLTFLVGTAVLGIAAFRISRGGKTSPPPPPPEPPRTD